MLPWQKAQLLLFSWRVSEEAAALGGSMLSAWCEAAANVCDDDCDEKAGSGAR